MSTELPQYKKYSLYRLKLIGDKDFTEITEIERDKIVSALVGGAKYINLGNIFFSASSISSILPINDAGKVVLQPNKPLKLSSGG